MWVLCQRKRRVVCTRVGGQRGIGAFPCISALSWNLQGTPPSWNLQAVRWFAKLLGQALKCFGMEPVFGLPLTRASYFYKSILVYAPRKAAIWPRQRRLASICGRRAQRHADSAAFASWVFWVYKSYSIGFCHVLPLPVFLDQLHQHLGSCKTIKQVLSLE